MPINPINFSQEPIDYGYGKMIDHFYKGYNSHLIPAQAEAGLQKTQSEGALNMAQAQRAMTPQMSEFMKLMQDQQQVNSMYPEGSPQREAFADYLAKNTQANNNNGITIDDGQGGTIQIGGSGGRGGKGGYSVGPNGEIIQAPSQSTTNEAQAQAIAKKSVEIYNTVKQPYHGRGANGKVAEDLYTYQSSKDPRRKAEAAKRLVEGALAAKLLPENAIAQLKAAGNTRITESGLAHQKKALTQGWGELTNLAFNNLPPELQEQVNNMYNDKIAEVGSTTQSFVAQGLPRKQSQSKYSQEDLEFTAKKHGKTVEELLIELGER